LKLVKHPIVDAQPFLIVRALVKIEESEVKRAQFYWQVLGVDNTESKLDLCSNAQIYLGTIKEMG